jgi:hypothetical protein
MARTAQVRKMAPVTMAVAMMMVAASGAGAEEAVTLEKATWGPYGGQTLVVANSEGSCRQKMAQLEAAGGLAITPAPEPPAGVNWSREVVVLVAAGNTGYEVNVKSSRTNNGRTKVEAEYLMLPNDGGGSLAYHLVKLPKTAYLNDQLAMGDEVPALLPMVGDSPSPIAAGSWGALKASYR